LQGGRASKTTAFRSASAIPRLLGSPPIIGFSAASPAGSRPAASFIARGSCGAIRVGCEGAPQGYCGFQDQRVAATKGQRPGLRFWAAGLSFVAQNRGPDRRRHWGPDESKNHLPNVAEPNRVLCRAIRRSPTVGTRRAKQAAIGQAPPSLLPAPYGIRAATIPPLFRGYPGYGSRIRRPPAL